ncbi:putative bifunctional diguanylate cyclase/phosphodiesterase [Persephonella sp.]
MVERSRKHLLNLSYMFIFIFILLGSSYILIPKFGKTIENSIINDAVLPGISKPLNNLRNAILFKASGQDIKYIFQSPSSRREIEKMFSLFLTPDVKYAYILYKDKDGKLRYLLDISLEDRARFWQKFDITNPEWYKVFENKKDLIIKQEKIDFLWITYIKPIIQQREVKGLIVLDFSIDKLREIKSVVKKIQNALLIGISFVLVSFIVSIYQFFRYEKKLKKMYYDPLTGAYNRLFLYENSDLFKFYPFTVFVIDIDHFKKINDTYGHEIGDFVLKELTRRINNCIRDNDILIRYGGEEFLLLVRANPIQPEYKKNILNLAKRIKNEIEFYPFNIENIKLKVTVSIGINFYEHEKSIEEAIKHADIALYSAKQKGRNRIEIYNVSLKINEENINVVKEAVEEGRIICHYQPIIDLKTITAIKFESLVRIITKDGEFLYPNEFIPPIKRTYVYVDITKKIIEFNKRVLQTYKDAELSINLSAMDIYNEDIIKLFAEIFERDEASRLTVEILESEEIENYEVFKNQLSKLQFIGCKIAIDDFGTGYSNFSHIIELNPDYLKIDGSLIQKIDVDHKAHSIVKAIKHFADDLNIKVVAEYVNNRDILEKVLESGIRYGQGYYLQPPIPPEDIPKFL